MRILTLFITIIMISGCGIFHPPLTIEQINQDEEAFQKKIIGELRRCADQDASPIPNSVGVLPFRESGDESGLGLAATEFFTANLGLFEQFELIDMAYATCLEQEFSTFSPEKKRKALKAEQLVRGVVLLAQEKLDVAGYNYLPGAADFQELAYFEGNAEDFFRLVADLNIRFLEKNGITVTPEMAKKLYEIPTENLQAYILYAKAQNYACLGDFKMARTTYLEAIKLDQEFEKAQKGLRQVEDLSDDLLQTTDMKDPGASLEEQIDTAPTLEEKQIPEVVVDQLELPPGTPEVERVNVDVEGSW